MAGLLRTGKRDFQHLPYCGAGLQKLLRGVTVSILRFPQGRSGTLKPRFNSLTFTVIHAFLFLREA